MSIVRTVAGVLAWPEDTGVAGGVIATAIMGVPAYIHTHVKLRRHHRERMDQANANHEALTAQLAARGKR